MEVHVAVFQRPGASTLFLDTARQQSIAVHAVPEKGRFDRAVLGELRALVGELRPDIVQSHAVKSHFVVRNAGVHKLAPWIAFHHGYTAPDARARLYNQLDWWSLRAARQAITVSLPFREDLIRKGVRPERVAVVHNAIDSSWGAAARRPETAAALRAKLGIAPSAKVLLIVGRLSHEKDHVTLLRAAAQLRSTGKAPEAHLLLVGDGPERARIQQAIAALGMEGAVTLTGHVPSAEPYYGIADIAVLSSLTEGSPNALLEAMAAGVPVVATRVGGIPEIVSHRETALLVQPGDRDAMAQSIGELVSNAAFAQELVERSRELVQLRHTPEARAQLLIDIYTRVAGAS